MKRLFPNIGLRAQFVLIACVCLVGTIIATSYHVAQREEKMLKEAALQQARILAGTSSVLFTNAFIYQEINLVEAATMTEYLDYYVSDVMEMDTRILSFAVLDQNQMVVTHEDLRMYGEKMDIADFASTMKRGEIVIRPYGKGRNIEILVPLAIEHKRWGLCRIVFSLAGVDVAVTTLKREVFGIAAMSLIFCLLLIAFAAEYFIHPLQKLSLAMGRVTVDKESSLVIPTFTKRRDEIGQLQQSFQWMASRLKEEEIERLKTMERLFQSEKMATVGTLTANIAHEINNPLGGVLLCFENLRRGGMDEKDLAQHYEVIEISLKRMQKTMGDLLNYSRQNQLDCRNTSFEGLIRENLPLLKNMFDTGTVTLSFIPPEEDFAIFVDVIKVQQVITNLVINGVQAMEGSGLIRLSLDGDDSFVRLLVCDSGCGVAKEIEDKIFDPFYTTKDVGEGTGLGLALSRSIAEQHGGKLSLYKADTEGTCFALSFPRLKGV